MIEKQDLLLENTEHQLSDDLFDCNHSTFPTRELRITLEPIASVVVSFDFEGSNNGRELELINSGFKVNSDKNVEFFHCHKGYMPDYYRGRTITDIAPSGGIEGIYKQQVEVKALQKGDIFGCRLLNESIPGATIKLEIFDNGWKVILHERITNSGTKHKINW